MEEKEVVKENKKWFDRLGKLPEAILIISMLAFFIIGIVYSVNIDMPETMLFFWLIGAIVCAITYFVYKVVLSYVVLHINYLEEILSCSKKMCEKLTENKKEE